MRNNQEQIRSYVSYLKSYSLVLVTVVVKGIVAGKGQEHTKTWTKRKEDLGCCINPNLTNKKKERNLYHVKGGY